MTWRQGLETLKDLERRQPAAWRLGAAALVFGGVTLLLTEAGKLPRLSREMRWLLIASLILLAPVVGRRVLWNDTERRLRAAWRVAGFGLLLVWFDITGIAAGLRLHPSELARGSGAVLSFSLALMVMVTLAAIIVVRVIDRRPVRQLGIVPGPGFWGDLAFGFGLGALLNTVDFGVESLAGWVRVVDVARNRTPGEPFLVAFAQMTAAFFCVGLYEELLNRGYLLRSLAQGFVGRRVKPTQALVLAVLLSSALFGLGHIGNPHATLVSSLNIAVAGVVLSLPYVLTGTLATSIGLHWAWNLFEGVVYGFPASGIIAPTVALVVKQSGPPLWTGGEFGPEAGLLDLLLTLTGGALIMWREHSRHGSLALCTALVDESR
jgi:membrane protease YdiL (CAAX protease family)